MEVAIQAASNEADPQHDGAARLWLSRIATIVVIALVLGLVAYGVKSLMGGHAAPKKTVTKIKLLPDTPPPPPPPPPKEPPKEQPKEQPKEMRVEPKQEAPKEAPAIKTDEAPSDTGTGSLASGAVRNETDKPGGTTIGGKKSLAAYAWYTGKIKSKIEDAIANQKDLANAQYRIVVFIWLARDGRVERAELQGTSGDQNTDALIRIALSEIKSLGEAPPDDMPLPIKMRITSKNSS
ncbi:MAG: TonB C-terminal domain-containing protein [Methylophilaceae bacterium]